VVGACDGLLMNSTSDTIGAIHRGNDCKYNSNENNMNPSSQQPEHHDDSERTIQYIRHSLAEILGQRQRVTELGDIIHAPIVLRDR